jgi:predicted RNA-binding protein YlxR (DUF448 family)
VHPKHLPQRQCVVCGVRAPQRELVRIALGPDGQLSVGTPGKRSGRGAYLCHKSDCWKGILKSDRLSRALKVELGTQGRELIAAYGSSMEQAIR